MSSCPCLYILNYFETSREIIPSLRIKVLIMSNSLQAKNFSKRRRYVQRFIADLKKGEDFLLYLGASCN